MKKRKKDCTHFMGFSVIMPTYNQAAYIRRAILSLKKQTYKLWELIIVNDGSSDDTEDCIFDILQEADIKYIKVDNNEGLGHAINLGLEAAKYEYIAYLPSDDFYYENHLECLKNKFEESDNISLVFNGIKFENSDSLTFYSKFEKQSNHIKQGYSLQLVQTAHKKTNDRWLERKEWVTEDLYMMFWHKLVKNGSFAMTGELTCYWTSHPFQHHKIAGEKYGGCINLYRSYYKVKTPIKMRLSKYKFIDEEKNYARFRKPLNKKQAGLKILLVGELAYNPERICALEEYGHTLYGLWIKEPKYPFSFVGNTPFGHIEDIPYDDNWKENILKIKPDIIYALTNWDGVNLAYKVLKANLKIPFVWHFKEGPMLCIKSGIWNKLYELYRVADGKIFLNNIIKSWYEQFIPPSDMSFILDLDPPKKDYFTSDFSPKLSAKDGAIHTVVVGRMIGLTGSDLKSLAKQNIHVHLYSEGAHETHADLNNNLKKDAPDHFHIHPHVPSDGWVKEFSKYDAGWLHCFDSHNEGNLLKATWDDLNIPARLYTLVAAGIPSIQKDNKSHAVAMQRLVKKIDIGIFFKNIDELGTIMRKPNELNRLDENIIQNREKFTFDYYVPELTAFFHTAINHKKKQNEKPFTTNS